MTTDVPEAASNWHSIKADVAADVAYRIARSQQATEEFYVFTIITTRVIGPFLGQGSSVELQPMSLGHDTDRNWACILVGGPVRYREQLPRAPECGHSWRSNKRTANGLRHAWHAPSELSDSWREFSNSISLGTVDAIQRGQINLIKELV
jgi:hypothetical protein